MFVRADHMLHHIRITNIRFERLQDISEKDCLAEGIWEAHDVGLEGVTYWYTGLANSPYRTAREAYAALIDKINGKGTWHPTPTSSSTTSRQSPFQTHRIAYPR